MPRGTEEGYLSSADQKSLAARYKTTALVVAVLGASLVLYLVLGWILPPTQRALELPGQGKFFYAIGIVLGLVVVLLRRIFLSNARLKRSPQAVVGSLGTVSILGAALGEAIAIIGLAAYLLTGDFDFCWRLTGVGLLLIIYSFPRRGEWVRALSAATKQSNA
jgi:F0F1-type ATP synthase membrane subunit c/vacuolar-type H+-ATPase subunit K